jgi:hypothetical protein
METRPFTRPTQDGRPKPAWLSPYYNMPDAGGGSGRRAFSGYPAAPSSPRDINNVDNAAIHEHIIHTEDGITASWGDWFRGEQDRELLGKITAAAMGRPPTPHRPVNRLGYVLDRRYYDAHSQPVSPRLPSSTAGSRVQGAQVVSMNSPRGREAASSSFGDAATFYSRTPADYSVADQVSRFKRGDYKATAPRSPRYLDAVDPASASPRPITGSISLWRSATTREDDDLRVAKEINEAVLERLRATPLHKPLTPRAMGRKALPFHYGRSLHGLLNAQGTDDRSA